MSKAPDPPVARTEPHTATWHGVTLSDDYHWLRDPGYPKVEDPGVLSYLNAENSYFEAVYQPLNPLVQTLFDELKARQPEQDESVPYAYRGYLYQWRFAKDAQYRTWWRAPENAPDTWQLMLDEPAMAAGREYFRLGGMAVHPAGDILAYSTDTDGSERFTLTLTGLNGATAPEVEIANTLGTPVWAADGQSFYYVALNDQWRPFQVRQHHLDDGADACVFEEADDAFFVGVSETQSERYVVISSGDHVTSEIWLIDQTAPEAPVCMAPRRTGHEYSVDHRADTFYILTNSRQRNFDLMTAPANDPEERNWQRFIDGDEALYLTDHLCLEGYVIVEQRRNGLEEVLVWQAGSGETHIIELPDAVGTVGFGTNPVARTHKLRLHYESMVRPGTVFDYHLQTRTSETLKVEEIPGGYSGDHYQTERRTIIARDGAQVPVSLVWHTDSPPSPDTPLYLYAYGAYGHAIPPAFSRARLSLLDRGVTYGIAHIRGGDDLGYHWYEAGKLEQRTNTFNDFVDVARGLIDAGLAGAGNIAIAGGSAGGELMGAVVNQAPELWGAVAAHVPFVDVLNTMLDDTLPLTPIEWPEWGNPRTDAQAFETIRSYSPYDQLVAGAYPPMLVTAGLNDPRVTYWEPAKYVAKLRTLKTDDNVLVLKTNMGAGHGGKSGRFESLREVAEEYAWMLTHLNGTQIADC